MANIVSITDLTHDYRGIAHVDGKTIFITNALPGEEVQYEILKKHRSYDEGKATEILSPSPFRVSPPCPFFQSCGGCSAQHFQIEAQRHHKQALLLEQLARIGKVTAKEIAPPIESPSWHYRTKARLGVRYVEKKQKTLVGFREKNGRYLADLESCHVLHPSIGPHLKQLRDCIETLSCKKEIPQIEIAVGEPSQLALIIRHLTPLSEEDKKRLQDFGVAYDCRIYLQPHGPQSIHKIWPLQGSDFLQYSLPAFGLTFEFHPSDFTQINSFLNPLMVSQAMEWLQPQKEERILDLFCGLGNFTLPLAQKAQHVVGIEGSDTMVHRAQENAKRHALHNTEFHAADLFQPLTQQEWIQPFDALLLDPPRSGAEAIVKSIEKFNPKRILYVSCNPDTFARDAGILVHEKHYDLLKVGMMDMFPHTAHVESMALFQKSS